MYIANELIRKFVERHDIKILDSSKRTRKSEKTTFNYFTDEKNYNYVVTSTVPPETETLYTLEIPESELKRISNFESQVFNNLIKDEHYNLFEVMVGLKSAESNLRSQYPAVQKAFEHYSLMLKIAESSELEKEEK